MGFREKYGWSLFVAQRYLFSKKSHNAINIITLVSMCGVTIGTMALICVLSVLNGFENLVNDSFVAFDPDLRITSTQGRTFDVSSNDFLQLRKSNDIQAFAEILSTNALLSYEGKQTTIELRGVSHNYTELNDIRSLIIDGAFDIEDRGVAGIGVANILGLSYDAPLSVYVPKRQANVNLARPDNAFYQQDIYLSGIFASGQEQCDNAVLFVPLEFAQELCDYGANEVSAIELKLKPTANAKKVEKELQAFLGDDFTILNRYEQQADFFRILQIEKWITFLILAFILLIASCNIIGSLSMLMINKQTDIELFYALGARNKKIQTLFLLEGWMIAIYGAVIGLILGVALCLLQQYVGIIKMGAGYMIENYPVDVRWGDIIIVFGTVIALGFALAAYPASLIRRKRLNKTI